MIDLTGAHPALTVEAASLLRRAWRDAADHVDVNAAAPPLGLPSLRQALGRALGEDPDLILITAGVRAAIPVLGRRLAHTTLEIPTFNGVATVLSALGYQPRLLPWPMMTGDGGAAWVTHPARNPDGASMTPLELQDLLGGAWSTVVVNESYRWYAPTRPVPALPGNAFAVGSLHKLAGPGARIGWIRGHDVPALDRHLMRISGPSPLSQQAWATFIDSGGLNALYPAVTAAVDARTAFETAAGEALKTGLASVGPSLLATTPSPWTGPEAARRVHAAGVAVTPGEEFLGPADSVALFFTGISTEMAAEAGCRFRTIVAAAT